MPIPVDDVSTLQAYLRGIIAKAKHHADNVDEIILGLTGAIISRKDPGSPLDVHKGQSGNMGSALTVTIRGKRYAFSYSHDDDCIQMKAGGYQGAVIHQFTNATSLAEVARIFGTL